MFSISPKDLTTFQTTGRALALAGLVHGSSGNLSLRLNDHLLITAHGSNLGQLHESDIIETGIHSDDAGTPHASFELPVHREIYRATGARALVHAHPLCAVAISTDCRIAIISGAPAVGKSAKIVAGVLAREIAAILNTHPIVMVRGHGTFAAANSLAEALDATLAFEEDCRKLCEKQNIKPDRDSLLEPPL